MKHRSFRRHFIGYCAMAMLCLLLLCACHDVEDATFRYDLSTEEVQSLDPQFSTDSDEILILSNLYEGLLVRGENGDFLPGMAESYQVSSDGLRYTFSLRTGAIWQTGDEDNGWQGGQSVTAGDFVYAFQRMFRDHSPYADQYMSIRGAKELYEGSAQTLSGVTANGDYELVITLNQPDSDFLDRLCEPAAAPCNEEVYSAAHGRYGLDLEYVCSNGPFVLNSWTEERVSMVKNETYYAAKETLAEQVHFYIGSEDAQQDYLDGSTDIAFLSPEAAESLEGDSLTPVTNTVWGVVFNQNSTVWGNALLRQGMVQAVDRSQIETETAGYSTTSLLLSDQMQVMGTSYRAQTFETSPVTIDKENAKLLFQQGLEQIGMQSLNQRVVLTVSEDVAQSLNLDALRTEWRDTLSAYVGVETVSAEELQSRWESGNFELILMPFSQKGTDPASVLSQFASGANACGYQDAAYDGQLQAAAEQVDSQQAAELYGQAEASLLENAVVLPLYEEVSYIATAKGVTGIQISLFGSRIQFRYAKK